MFITHQSDLPKEASIIERLDTRVNKAGIDYYTLLSMGPQGSEVPAANIVDQDGTPNGPYLSIFGSVLNKLVFVADARAKAEAPKISEETDDEEALEWVPLAIEGLRRVVEEAKLADDPARIRLLSTQKTPIQRNLYYDMCEQRDRVSTIHVERELYATLVAHGEIFPLGWIKSELEV